MFNLLNVFKPNNIEYVNSLRNRIETLEEQLQKALAIQLNIQIAQDMMNGLMPEGYKIFFEKYDQVVVCRVLQKKERNKPVTPNSYYIEGEYCESIAYLKYKEVAKYVKSLAFNK